MYLSRIVIPASYHSLNLAVNQAKPRAEFNAYIARRYLGWRILKHICYLHKVYYMANSGSSLIR